MKTKIKGMLIMFALLIIISGTIYFIFMQRNIQITSVWAVNDGEKILQDELSSRFEKNNSVWDGKYNTPVLTSNWSNAPGLCIAAHVDGKDTQCNTYLTFHGASRLAEFDSRIYTIADTFLTLGASQRSAYARLKLMEFYKRGG